MRAEKQPLKNIEAFEISKGQRLGGDHIYLDAIEGKTPTDHCHGQLAAVNGHRLGAGRDRGAAWTSDQRMRTEVT